MSTLATILNTLVVILAVLLIALILVQPSKSGGGFGSAFGGLGESVFGAQAMSHLSKLTVWCMSIFFVLTLASAIVAGHIRTSDSSVVQEESSIALTGSVGEETAVPAAEAVKPAAETASETVAEAVKTAEETASEAAANAPAEAPAVPVEKPATETQN